ncbi:MAG TPA: hypothetical protein ENJ01_11865 [Gammaproteobacteria bacterium]|nr:hypothetical protein [Gammaproteobacteria bacterium]
MISDIYFFNACGLANELRDGTVSEARAVKHLIAAIIIGGLTFGVPVTVECKGAETGFGETAGFLVLTIITAFISYYGIWMTYQANRKGDGKDYFLRFSVLTLPVGLQLVVLFALVSLLLFVPLSVLIAESGWLGQYTVEALFYSSYIVFTVMFYLRMRKFISVASGAGSD